jgi:glyoxylase-like metal-dependent hydrolase (beta-lactamase superfamily II)
MVGSQAPGFYRFKLGAFEATVISDGPLPLGEPKAGVFGALSKEDFGRMLGDNYLPTDNVTLEQNALVINTGDRLMLIDTGMGSEKALGPDTGRLVANLKAAGIDAQNIDAVLLTHAHPDHCWGLMGEGDARTFPNAQIHMSEADLAFWTDEAKLSDQMIGSFVAGTRRHLLPNRDRIVFVKDGQEVVPGIQAMETPGHTVGHTSYAITSQGKTLYNIGDVAHHHVVSTERPREAFMFDTDGQQGIASRLRVLDMLAGSRTAFIAYHFPWPGIGYVGKRGDAYRYFAAPMQTVL